MFVAHTMPKYAPKTFLALKAGTISSRPASRLGGVNTAGMNKLEARKMQMLTSQRKELEEELLALEDEILNAVRMNYESISCGADSNHRKGNHSRNPENEMIPRPEPELQPDGRFIHVR